MALRGRMVTTGRVVAAVFILSLCTKASATNWNNNSEPPIWLKPYAGADASVAVNVDGRFSGIGGLPEYARGRLKTLNNWKGDFGSTSPANGELYMQLISWNDVPGFGGHLFLGVRIPRFFNPAIGTDNGVLELYLSSTKDGCGSLEDRRIVITFAEPNANTSPADTLITDNVAEWKGVPGQCNNYQSLAGGDTPLVVRHKLRWNQNWGDNKQYDFAEIELLVPEAAMDAQKIYLAMRYTDEDYVAFGAPANVDVLNLPDSLDATSSGAPNRISFGTEATYQLLDLSPSNYTTFGVGTYNVGQMIDAGFDPSEVLTSIGDLAPWIGVDNGGVGHPDSIGEQVWSRDIICFQEAMEADDREDIVKYANNYRSANGLEKWTGIYVKENAAINEMLATSWTVIDSEIKRYNELGAGGADDLIMGSARGAKGVIWARLGPPKRCGHGTRDPLTGLCPENDEVPVNDYWIDVFCTHVQAPCSPTKGGACSSIKDNDKQGERSAQFQKLGEYIAAKRAIPGPGGSKGLERPALVLGDLNQDGPRNTADSWGSNLESWVTSLYGTDIFPACGPQSAIAAAYKDMRLKVGNWDRTSWDEKNADEIISGYDISANAHGIGSWIGDTNYGGQVDSSASYSCTPTWPDLTMQARVDYIMIVPATPTERPFPMYGFRYNPGHTAGVDIDRHFHGNKTLFKESGCLSDHAEVVGYLDLVPYVVKSPPNPKRANRVRWYVTHLFDIYNDDDTAFDDGSTDWFTNNLPDEFLLMGRDLAGAEIAGTCNHGNQTWFAPEGRDVAGGIPWDYRGPLLYDGYTSNLMLAVWDHDGGSNHDWYDANPFPGYKNLDLVVDLANRAITERGGANTKVTNFFNQNVVKMTSRGWEGASANVEFYIETCEANQSPAYYPCIPKNCP